MSNHSAFLPLVAVVADEEGTDALFVVVRGTFPLSADPRSIPKPVPPTGEDVYWGEPAKTSLKYAAEIHVGKRGTDVVMIGCAHAPRGRPVSDMLVALSVAERRKVVRVCGDRTWRATSGALSRPEPFTSMPLKYERAFGGVHESTDPRRRTVAEERNPVGVGFRGGRAPSDAVGQKVPNLEDPTAPIARFGDCPPPAGFGFIAPSWLPRRTYAGTYDDAWKARRCPYLPRDFDRRFSNAASGELAFDRFLTGGEPLIINGAHPDGTLSLSLPTMRPRITVVIRGQRLVPDPELETVLIEPDDDRLCLSWRAKVPCDKQALKIETILIEGGA